MSRSKSRSKSRSPSRSGHSSRHHSRGRSSIDDGRGSGERGSRDSLHHQIPTPPPPPHQCLPPPPPLQKEVLIVHQKATSSGGEHSSKPCSVHSSSRTLNRDDLCSESSASFHENESFRRAHGGSRPGSTSHSGASRGGGSSRGDSGRSSAAAAVNVSSVTPKRGSCEQLQSSLKSAVKSKPCRTKPSVGGPVSGSGQKPISALRSSSRESASSSSRATSRSGRLTTATTTTTTTRSSRVAFLNLQNSHHPG